MKSPLLASYAVIRKWNTVALDRLLQDDRVEVLIDSGAFSAKNSGAEINLSEYMKFINDHKDRLFGYIALDVIGNPVETEINLKTMLDAGLKPLPVHTLTEDQERMDYLFTLSDWVALGGFRRPGKGSAPEHYIAMKMKWAAGRNVHWLGYTRQPQLLSWKPYSCDSASWASGMLYGRMSLYMGNGKWVGFNKEEFFKKNLLLNRDVYRRFDWYEFDYSILTNERAWRNTRGKTILDLQTKSWIEFQQDILRIAGTRLFLAISSDPLHLVPIIEGINLAERRAKQKGGA